ncbi:MAG TPA: VIT1/CCC1 transporter family protein [Puia sp.]|jgi:VIT1/CCC1 family predicted Fe2+/Mn2+ transporter
MNSPEKADLPVKLPDHAHNEEHVFGADVLRDVVIGMSDGLTVPFALAAGLSGAVSSTSLIIIAGLAEIAAGSIAMGLGGYLAGKTEAEHYHSELQREYDEVEKVPEMEKQELRTFFSSLGLSREVQEQAVEEVSQDKEKWVELMMKYELGLEKPDPRRAKKSAFNIGFSYIVGGLIPLSPYFFVSNGIEGLKVSAVITLICLFVFGYIKSKFTGVNRWEGAMRVMIIGAIAAGCAFAIARLIQTGHY